jgi:hypothetical protein
MGRPHVTWGGRFWRNFARMPLGRGLLQTIDLAAGLRSWPAGAEGAATYKKGHPDRLRLNFDVNLLDYACSLLGAIGVVIAGRLTLALRRREGLFPDGLKSPTH